MTISNTIRTAGPYIGNDVTTVFPFYFKIFKTADLLVVQTDVATGVATPLVLNSGYTVTLNADQNANPGGTATLPAALTTGKTLVLTSDLAYLQPLDITNGGGFYPSVLNAAFDRLTIFCQQLFSLASRSLKLPLSDTGMNTELPSATARANNLLGFDSLGRPTTYTPASGSAADVLMTIANPGGADITGYLLASGLYPQTTGERLREKVNLMPFIPIAERAAIINKTSTYDASADISRAIAFCNTLPKGAKLLAGRGKFRCASRVLLKNDVSIYGEGKRATEFEFTHNGDGFVSLNPINSSSAANIVLSDFSVTSLNGSSIGGGVVDVCGTFVTHRNLRIQGFKYSVILDQSELTDLDQIDCEFPLTGGVWLTNGPDHTPGAAVQFTNRISVKRSQFNSCPIGIIDDGGYVHDFQSNNYNGGNISIRAAGVNNLSIRNSEFEATAIGPIDLQNTTYNSGTGVGGNLTTLADNTIVPGASFAVNIAAGSGGGLISQSNVYSGSPSAKIVGIRNLARCVLQNDGVSSGPYTDAGDVAAASTAQLVFGGTVSFQTGAACQAFAYKADASGGGSEASKFELQANNSASNRVTYAGISAGITGNGAGAESGILFLKTNNAGTFAPRWGIQGVGQFYPIADNTQAVGGPSNRPSVIYAGTGTINTSDEREKDPVIDIDTAAIRAVRKVKFKQFKFSDAVSVKGDAARWHFGVIAQQVKAAFESEGLDPFEYGVLCYDEWEQTDEVKDDEGNIVVPYAPAGNRYGIRYDELLCLKMASF